MRVGWPAVRPLTPCEQLLQGHVVPPPALELGEGYVHGDLLGSGGEAALSPEGVKVTRYLDQRLLGEVPDVGLYATSVTAEGCLQPAHEQVVEVRERLAGVWSPQLCEPLFVCAFSHLRPIPSRFLYPP